MQIETNSTVGFVRNLFKPEIIHIDRQNVIGSIGNSYTDWNPRSPIFIDAPTGTGKTTLIYEKLIPDAISKKRSVLLVSNRIALSMQQKGKVTKALKKIDPSLISYLPDDIGRYPAKEYSFLGPVCVVTYQGLFSLINNPPQGFDFDNWCNTLLYAVFDEVHFLYSDAQFNPICGHLLHKIPVVFSTSIRIYMTATSWDIIDPLLNAEKDALDNCERFSLKPNEQKIATHHVPSPKEYILKRRLYHYQADADYSLYHLHFFDDRQYTLSPETMKIAKKITQKKYLLSLVSLIQNSDASSENKWLIFIDKKNSGLTLKRILEDCGIETAYIDAHVKHTNKTWKKIVREESFKETVLIATSVLECGVNIKDAAVKNIAFFCTDHTSFIQMLGRKRLDEKNDKDKTFINIWVWNPSIDYFKNIEIQLLHKINLANQLADYRTNYYRDRQRYTKLVRRIWADKKHFDCRTLFRIDHMGLLSVDNYVRWILNRKLEFIQNFTRSNNPLHFSDVVEEWLGIPGTFVSCPQAQTTDMLNPTADLSILLENNKDTMISNDAFKSIRTAILAAKPDSMNYYIRPERKDNCSAKTLNRILEHLKLPYFIKKQAKIWTITRIQSNN